MRIVIYDDELLEPITVINLPITDMDISQRNMHWRVPVPIEFSFHVMKEAELQEFKCVDLWFEPWCRVHPRYGKQQSWACFTRAADLAMLLEPDWLPGQRSGIAAIEARDKILVKMIMNMIKR